MQNDKGSELVRLVLSDDQKAAIKGVIGREGEALELRVVELEERIVPRLASNHNEPLLIDR
jgi:hypothetical protein